MLCDRCGKREATVQYIQVINGKDISTIASHNFKKGPKISSFL